MKKIIYLLTLMLAVTLINVSCEKNEDPANQTLAEMYPDWTNLTWISTDGNSTPTVYPRLTIKVIGNVATIYETKLVSNSPVTYTFNYDALDITVTTATFFLPQTGAVNQTMTIMTPPDNTKIKVSWQNHTYLLQIN